MAIDFIKVNVTADPSDQSRTLTDFVRQLRIAYDMGRKIQSIMGHANDGSNFTLIETLYALPAGKGQTVFDLVNGAVGSMEGAFQTADAKNLTERVG